MQSIYGFRYMLATVGLAATISVVGCGGDGSSAGNSSAPAPVPKPLTLSGTVRMADDGSVDGGSIRAQIGTLAYPGTLVSGGSYTMPIADTTCLKTSSMTAVEYFSPTTGTSASPVALVTLPSPDVAGKQSASGYGTDLSFIPTGPARF